jgi:hypothetical protein
VLSGRITLIATKRLSSLAMSTGPSGGLARHWGHRGVDVSILMPLTTTPQQPKRFRTKKIIDERYGGLGNLRVYNVYIQAL